MTEHPRLRRGARIGGGVLGLAVLGGVVAAGTILPLPAVDRTPPSSLITPEATGQQRLCPGGLIGIGAGGSATATSFLASPSATAGTSTGEGPGVNRIAVPDVASEGGPDGSPFVLTAPGTSSGDPLLLAGGQSQVVNAGESVGFSATACAEASSDGWLAAGSTVVGRTSILLLSNPSAVTATVDLTIFGEEGPVSAPGSAGISIVAGAQRVIPLAGLAPDITSPVVRVQSTGGQVVAALQSSVVRGLEPGGVELTGLTAGPGLTQVLPGLRVSAAAGDAAVDPAAPPAPPEAGGDAAAGGTPPTPAEESNGSDTETALRVFVPGDEDAVLTIGVRAEAGSAGAGLSFPFEAPAGRVTDIPFTEDLAEGLYTVTVESTVPVVASARSSTGGGASAVDLAWFAAPTGPVSGETLVAVPQGPDPRVHLLNLSDAPARAVLTPATPAAEGAAEVVLDVPAGAPVSSPVAAGTVYRLSSAEPLFGSVTFLGDGQLSAFPINPGNPSASPLRVYP
ncbi:DUF5719 family protein [Microbacteriaceae bacterium 4G12]